jgi:hypothetical protein
VDAHQRSILSTVRGMIYRELRPAGLSAHVDLFWYFDGPTAHRYKRILPNGKVELLVVEGVYPPRIDRSEASRSATYNDVNMLVSTGGRHRSEAEMRSLYTAAGFELHRIVPTTSPISILEGIPA